MYMCVANTDNLDTGVCENTFLLWEPWPCNPAAKAALQALVRCFERLSSQGPSSPEECFFTDTGNVDNNNNSCNKLYYTIITYTISYDKSNIS